jgi:hypothetical protein
VLHEIRGYAANSGLCGALYIFRLDRQNGIKL